MDVTCMLFHALCFGGLLNPLPFLYHMQLYQLIYSIELAQISTYWFD